MASTSTCGARGDRGAFVFGRAKLTLPIPSAVGSFAKLGAEVATSLLGLAPDARRDGWVAVAFLAVCAFAIVLAGVPVGWSWQRWRGRSHAPPGGTGRG